jgi:hypothetical protein
VALRSLDLEPRRNGMNHNGTKKALVAPHNTSNAVIVSS